MTVSESQCSWERVNQLRGTRQRFPGCGVNLFRMDHGSHKSQITVIETETETVRLKLIFNEVRFIIMYILLYIYNIHIIYI